MADALLLAGPKNGLGILRGWIPAKVFEYLATDLPIIYVGTRDSDVAELLALHPGTHLVETGDVDGMIGALRACRGHRHMRDVSAFTRMSLAGRLAGLLNEASTSAR
jgi:hypothetical protein